MACQWKSLAHLSRNVWALDLAVMSKEWARSIHKLSVELNKEQSHMLVADYKSGGEMSETTSLADNPQSSEEAPNESSLFHYSGLPSLWNSIRSNFSTSTTQNAQAAQLQVVPKWKNAEVKMVTKDMVATRLKHLLHTISNTETIPSRLKRIEDLISYVAEQPEAKIIAVKNGAINELLRVKRYSHDYDTQCVLRQLLTMLGYVEPLNKKGIRILSIDGGGTRGLVVIELLRKLEELSGRPVYDMFDYICGVSTGAILAVLFGPHKKNLQDCAALYREIGSRIFTQNALVGTSSLLWSHSYYNTALWEELLQKFVGQTVFIHTSRDAKCPKVSAVSAVVNQTQVKPFVFRNYEVPCGVPALYSGSSRAELWQVVRASAAAPTYFEEFRMGELLHQDGGILVNNPTAVAIHEAKLLWPGEPLQCVVSFGTGRNHPTGTLVTKDSNTSADVYTSWRTKFSKILDSATDTEGVHATLHDLLPNDVYFRFNPYVNEISGMDEMRPEKLEQLEREAVMYARRNEEKFQQVAAVLSQPRSYVQRTKDWLKLQAALLVPVKFEEPQPE